MTHQRGALSSGTQLPSQMAPSSDKPTIVCDGAGKVVGVNDAWSALCGYTESEALGKRPADLLQCETTEFDVAAEFTKTLLATGRSEAILTNRTKDGRVFKHRLVAERLGNLLIAEGTVIVPPAPRKAATRKATRASSADVWGALVSLVALLAAFAAAYDLAAAPDEPPLPPVESQELAAASPPHAELVSLCKSVATGGFIAGTKAGAAAKLAWKAVAESQELAAASPPHAELVSLCKSVATGGFIAGTKAGAAAKLAWKAVKESQDLAAASAPHADLVGVCKSVASGGFIAGEATSRSVAQGLTKAGAAAKTAWETVAPKGAFFGLAAMGNLDLFLVGGAVSALSGM